MSTLCLDRASPHNSYDERGVAAMEFAIVAPIMLLLVWGVFDVARALLAWEETYNSAQAIAQAAEKMSYSTRTYDGTTNPVTALTAQQMQNAMTTIYAEMPWLNLGQAGALFPGSYQVTLSSVIFTPSCAPLQQCGVQTPYVIWSSYLSLGGGSLNSPPAGSPTDPYRLCGPLIPVAEFPNNNLQLLDMIDPNYFAQGAHNIIMIPQVVADVVYTFKPSFPLLSSFTYTFYASATFPAPVGNDSQAIVFDEEGYSGNTVLNCLGGNPYNG